MMTKIDCPKFDDCSAPLCPLDPSNIWYPDEEVCKRRDFQNLDWIRKQKAIVKAKAPHDKFFSVKMLEALKQVRKGIEGINPDQPLQEAKEAEKRWVAEKRDGRVVAKKNQRCQRVRYEKKKDLVGVTSTSNQTKGSEL